jgi:hypothetical protein
VGLGAASWPRASHGGAAAGPDGAFVTASWSPDEHRRTQCLRWPRRGSGRPRTRAGWPADVVLETSSGPADTERAHPPAQSRGGSNRCPRGDTVLPHTLGSRRQVSSRSGHLPPDLDVCAITTPCPASAELRRTECRRSVRVNTYGYGRYRRPKGSSGSSKQRRELIPPPRQGRALGLTGVRSHAGPLPSRRGP